MQGCLPSGGSGVRLLALLLLALCNGEPDLRVRSKHWGGAAGGDRSQASPPSPQLIPASTVAPRCVAGITCCTTRGGPLPGALSALIICRPALGAPRAAPPSLQLLLLLLLCGAPLVPAFHHFPGLPPTRRIPRTGTMTIAAEADTWHPTLDNNIRVRRGAAGRLRWAEGRCNGHAPLQARQVPPGSAPQPRTSISVPAEHARGVA